jgi:hypothetical protein
MRAIVLTALTVIILSGCDAPAPSESQGNSGGPPAPPGAPGSNLVTITDTAANFGGKDVAFPATRAQLVAALGEPDRTVDKVNKIFVWDKRGIYAYSKTDRDFIHDISFSYAKEEWDYAPKTTFTGSIVIGDATITPSTTDNDLKTAGFKQNPDDPTVFEKTLGANMLLIEAPGRVKAATFTVP